MIVARAPLRIPLGGGGTDLPSYASRFGGFVVSAAIDKYVYVCAHRPAVGGRIRLKYSRYEEASAASEIAHDLVQPALESIGPETNIEIASLADVPASTGLGSSGSYLVALLTALHALKGEHLDAHALAEEAAHIEMIRAGHPVGKHDHFLAAFGGLRILEIAADGTVAVSALDLGTSAVEAFRRQVMLFYTGITRPSAEVLSEQQRDTNEGRAHVIESLHRTKELGYRIREALQCGDIGRFGILLDEHWQNKKRRSQKVSDDRIDAWYELAKRHGALGGKIMGAGGGGFFMICCPVDRQCRLRQELTSAGLVEMAYDFALSGAAVMNGSG